MSLILEAGSDLQAKDTQDRTAVPRGAGSGHPEIASLLIGARADPDDGVDSSSRRVLHISAEKDWADRCDWQSRLARTSK